MGELGTRAPCGRSSFPPLSQPGVARSGGPERQGRRVTASGAGPGTATPPRPAGPPAPRRPRPDPAPRRDKAAALCSSPQLGKPRPPPPARGRPGWGHPLSCPSAGGQWPGGAAHCPEPVYTWAAAGARGRRGAGGGRGGGLVVGLGARAWLGGGGEDPPPAPPQPAGRGLQQRAWTRRGAGRGFLLGVQLGTHLARDLRSESVKRGHQLEARPGFMSFIRCPIMENKL